MIVAFVACQLFIVLFIALHDWVPLGSLNNLKGVNSVDRKSKLVIVTVLSALPFAVGLVGTAYYSATSIPGWLWWWLWIAYGGAIYGVLRAWYAPYLLAPEPARVTRYQEMFAHTHTFLPARNGIAPNTLHVIFHIVLITAVVLLACLTYTHIGG